MIFGYAIPRLEDIKLISPFSWNYNELDNRKKHGKSYITRPFPAPLVDRFLVSRRYFLNAAKAFISDQAIESPRDYYRCDSSPHYNIVMRFMQTARVELFSVESLCGSRAPKAPMLKEIVIRLDEYDLDCFETIFPWEEEFAEDHFKFLARRHGLENLAHVKKYRFESGPFQWRKLQAERQMCYSNARKFEEYVRSYVGDVQVETNASDFDVDAGFPPAPNTAPESNETAHSKANSMSVSGEEMQAGMTLAQLPDTDEEMMELLKSNGKEVAGLLRALKYEEKAKHNMQDPCVQQ